MSEIEKIVRRVLETERIENGEGEVPEGTDTQPDAGEKLRKTLDGMFERVRDTEFRDVEDLEGRVEALEYELNNWFSQNLEQVGPTISWIKEELDKSPEIKETFPLFGGLIEGLTAVAAILEQGINYLREHPEVVAALATLVAVAVVAIAQPQLALALALENPQLIAGAVGTLVRAAAEHSNSQ